MKTLEEDSLLRDFRRERRFGRWWRGSVFRTRVFLTLLDSVRVPESRVLSFGPCCSIQLCFFGFKPRELVSHQVLILFLFYIISLSSLMSSCLFMSLCFVLHCFVMILSLISCLVTCCFVCPLSALSSLTSLSSVFLMFSLCISQRLSLTSLSCV